MQNVCALCILILYVLNLYSIFIQTLNIFIALCVLCLWRKTKNCEIWNHVNQSKFIKAWTISYAKYSCSHGNVYSSSSSTRCRNNSSVWVIKSLEKVRQIWRDSRLKKCKLWSKIVSKVWIILQIFRFFCKKKTAISKCYIFLQNCKDFPLKAQFSRNEIPKIHIFFMHCDIWEWIDSNIRWLTALCIIS